MAGHSFPRDTTVWASPRLGAAQFSVFTSDLSTDKHRSECLFCSYSGGCVRDRSGASRVLNVALICGGRAHCNQSCALLHGGPQFRGPSRGDGTGVRVDCAALEGAQLARSQGLCTVSSADRADDLGPCCDLRSHGVPPAPSDRNARALSCILAQVRSSCCALDRILSRRAVGRGGVVASTRLRRVWRVGLVGWWSGKSGTSASRMVRSLAGSFRAVHDAERVSLDRRGRAVRTARGAVPLVCPPGHPGCCRELSKQQRALRHDGRVVDDRRSWLKRPWICRQVSYGMGRVRQL